MLRLLLVVGVAVLGYLYFGALWAWANVQCAQIFFWLFP